MRPDKLTIYRCANCHTLFEDEAEALNCCFDGSIEGWQCSECGELYEDRDEAKECCA